jgi:hypothetical protein
LRDREDFFLPWDFDFSCDSSGKVLAARSNTAIEPMREALVILEADFLTEVPLVASPGGWPGIWRTTRFEHGMVVPLGPLGKEQSKQEERLLA